MATALQWILRARVDTARELLESTRLSVDRIADQVGLGTGSNLRLDFRRLLDVSPSELPRHLLRAELTTAIIARVP